MIIKGVELKNNTVLIKLMKMIIPYSTMKIIENSPPKYSMLKPDTISDSPSEKSKGVRFDSENLRNIHRKSALGKKKAPLRPLSQYIIKYNVMFEKMYTSHKINRITQTSYEIV